MKKNEAEQSGARILEASNSTWRLVETRGMIWYAGLSRNSGIREGGG